MSVNYINCDCCKLKPSLCHGVEGSLGIAGCSSFDHKLCREKGWTCVCDPEQLCYRLREVQGFECVLKHKLRPIPHLPHFIPTIYHRITRNNLLKLDWVAIPLHALLVKNSNGALVPIATTANELRSGLGLQRSTRIVVTGPGPDQMLEDFWRFHRSGGLLQLLVILDIDLITAPNYSFFLDSTPLHYRYNRSRILRITERISQAGLNAVIHINALHEQEWQDWEKLLIAHTEITAICLEFQTGYSSPDLGLMAFHRLIRLQDNVNRTLHPILIGGARWAVEAGRNFKTCTIIDAQPFMHTMHRKDCWINESGSIEWLFKRSQLGEELGGRFLGNLNSYEMRLQQRLHGQLPLHQTEFGFKIFNSRPLRPRSKQRPIADLPLFAEFPAPPQSNQHQESRSHSELPNRLPVFRQNSSSLVPAPAKLALVTNRSNLRHRTILRKQPPNVFVAMNKGDASAPR